MYTTMELVEATGLTYRQTDWFTRKGLLVPSTPANGSGSRRFYSSADVIRGRLIFTLRELGACTGVIGRALAELGDEPDEWPGWLFVGLDGQVHRYVPQTLGCWWTIRTASLRAGESQAA